MQYHVESTHFHSRFYEVLKMGLIFNTLKQTYKHIKRKESINIKLIMKKLCKNEHNMKSPPPQKKTPLNTFTFYRYSATSCDDIFLTSRHK